ncbi:hypothetical protein NEMBOFW57_001813 [Staphylotrichum longicolle]|uniref:RanBP2-type domain-containing protein n=1 Tax=Staphylotrichum longicolle TaxID=669026 RepID=A0AAD4F1W5_9PEZI|nr:hypothetical protein NEMBOFW57_001813 [Staphylotrichum longicolle]
MSDIRTGHSRGAQAVAISTAFGGLADIEAMAVVLDGLPEDATERDILYGLDYVTRDRHFSSDQVRVARVRSDHNGHRTAFVEFHRRSDAEYFYDRYYPDVSFPLEHSRGLDSEPITVGVSFPGHRDEMDSSRDSRREDDGWDCSNCGVINYPHRAVCFKCKAERPEDDYAASGPFLTGETDECPQQTPSQYIVVRDLEGSVTEEVLARGVMKLFVEQQERAKETPTTSNKLKSTAPVNSTVGLGAKPGSLRRVFLMRDRKTNESWRYGFAEFATVEDAVSAVAKFRASTRFTIASKPVVVGFIHTGVFIPDFDEPATENQEFSFTPIYNPAVRLRYWDERAYPSAHVVSTAPLPDAPSPEKPGGSDEVTKSGAKPFKKVKNAKEPALAAKIAMTPQIQLWTKASAQLHGAKPAADAGAPAVQTTEEVRLPVVPTPREADDTLPDGPVAPQVGDQYLSYADWDALACLTCNWEAPSQAHINDRGWPQTRSDLLIEHEGRAHISSRTTRSRRKQPLRWLLEARNPASSSAGRRASSRSACPSTSPTPTSTACAASLCKRVFKDVRLIWLHEQQSELHKRMLADPQNRARAADEFKALGKKMHIVEPETAFKTRWEAQRVRFLQPQPTPPPTAAGQPAGAAVPEKRKEPVKTADDQGEEPAAKKSRRAACWPRWAGPQAQGWAPEARGRTEAISTEVYAPGVGLGAEGGKLGDASEEAARNTRGDFAAFVEKTRDRARERFERM